MKQSLSFVMCTVFEWLTVMNIVSETCEVKVFDVLSKVRVLSVDTEKYCVWPKTIEISWWWYLCSVHKHVIGDWRGAHRKNVNTVDVASQGVYVECMIGKMEN